MAQSPQSPYTPITPIPPSQAYVQPQYSLTQQQTMPQQPAIYPPANPAGPGAANNPNTPPVPTTSHNYRRLFAIILAIALAIALYVLWHASNTTSTPPAITQTNFGNPSTKTTTLPTNSVNTGGELQVYIVGAIKHPGVYSLPADARVYQLLQTAGGPLPNANLVALNLAAKLTDGQEVYVTKLGEAPPTYLGGVPGPGTGNAFTGTPSSGQLVNINTASVDELRQNLHVSSTTAQNIVNYRMQHGNYTSVDGLLQVVSHSIYDHIKGMVTV